MYENVEKYNPGKTPPADICICSTQAGTSFCKIQLILIEPIAILKIENFY